MSVLRSLVSVSDWVDRDSWMLRKWCAMQGCTPGTVQLKLVGPRVHGSTRRDWGGRTSPCRSSSLRFRAHDKGFLSLVGDREGPGLAGFHGRIVPSPRVVELSFCSGEALNVYSWFLQKAKERQPFCFVAFSRISPFPPFRGARTSWADARPAVLEPFLFQASPGYLHSDSRSIPLFDPHAGYRIADPPLL